MNGIIDLSVFQVLLAYIFIVLLVVILRVKGIAREKEVLISSIRMTLQLILVGYVLVYLFESMYPLLTLLVLLVMESFAIYNIIQRAKSPLSRELKKIVALSMVLGTLTSLLFFLFVVIQISPWYDPQYFIPIAGMLIGNSMTGISLGVNRLAEGMKDQKTLVESALMLGATPKEAAKEVVDSAFDAAILPTINSMVGMGIVFLPGMMTGQILSGVSPVTAIAYQIAIMLGIVGSVSLTVILFVQLGYKSFFNERAQLKTD
ncbi:ABC transporter permease [Isachenkonia alkalipeptolytica]|uniref:Iron export ABC transporter permease subunit FetB n=1 Tax=Isachenkonia alkalipeptolytica TaxID=2565777 RepID=A0AA44BG33_9CLOT|nr:iron export ABC transporter permease subunit FetB [Isachenkonia alkalipeptolytica]NBG89460.1 iron export ABC transporter permease subunit FetB [Isachenkonia alkalipeptolytica]